MRLSNLWKIIISVLVAELAGVIGSLFTFAAIPTWYATLAKPAFNPPNWVFAPVWNILFILMGVAAFLVWKRGLDKKAVRLALILFLVQLVLNSFWSIIFFGLHNPGAAYIEIIFLWLAILATIISFYKVVPKAAYLLIPYILWVTFAAFLNLSIWRLQSTTVPPVNDVACTMEAKICPDGSSVGRSGPNCEFTPCPTLNNSPVIPVGWLTVATGTPAFSFSYPPKLATAYITPVSWPPQVALSGEPFNCSVSDATSSLPSRTQDLIVNNREYCLKSESEGAAGSVYTTYDYTALAPDSVGAGKTVTFSFVLQYPQCYNYDNPQQSACTNEHQNFDLNGLVDQMAQSLQLKQ
jgi:tryptophan-rich sensory protein